MGVSVQFDGESFFRGGGGEGVHQFLGGALPLHAPPPYPSPRINHCLHGVMQSALLPRARAHARARGYVIGRGVYILCIISARTFFYLSKYSLSDAHFSTGRLLFEFNRLQYTLAAPEVFVSSANPVILPSGYRVSIVRNTNIY